MKIENCLIEYTQRILDLYGQATSYMKSKNQVAWPEFSRALVQQEIEENRQWKLLKDDQLACIWATTLSDPLIWGARNADPAVYIHRIATSPEHRGQNLVQAIIQWAETYCINHGLEYIRMDTVGVNQGLIDHYGKNGFEFLGAVELKDIEELPAHYSKGAVCLFQRAVKL